MSPANIAVREVALYFEGKRIGPVTHATVSFSDDVVLDREPLGIDPDRLWCSSCNRRLSRCVGWTTCPEPSVVARSSGSYTVKAVAKDVAPNRHERRRRAALARREP